MQTEKLIAIDEFCVNHSIDISFVCLLQQTGLIEIISVNENTYINNEQLRQLERILHFYYELEINLEGIEAITHLLKRMNTLQSEIITLNNRLRLYE